jgi:hypothetical protein
MGDRDGFDDREAETRAPAAAGVSGATEALKRSSEQLGREALALVPDA